MITVWKLIHFDVNLSRGTTTLFQTGALRTTKPLPAILRKIDKNLIHENYP